jgi:hypothetical protein
MHSDGVYIPKGTEWNITIMALQLLARCCVMISCELYITYNPTPWWCLHGTSLGLMHHFPCARHDHLKFIKIFHNSRADFFRWDFSPVIPSVVTRYHPIIGDRSFLLRASYRRTLQSQLVFVSFAL